MITCRTNFKNSYDMCTLSKWNECKPTGLSFQDAKLQKHLSVTLLSRISSALVFQAHLYYLIKLVTRRTVTYNAQYKVLNHLTKGHDPSLEANVR
jgi:hypothetical protein